MSLPCEWSCPCPPPKVQGRPMSQHWRFQPNLGGEGVASMPHLPCPCTRQSSVEGAWCHESARWSNSTSAAGLCKWCGRLPKHLEWGIPSKLSGPSHWHLYRRENTNQTSSCTRGTPEDEMHTAHSSWTNGCFSLPPPSTERVEVWMELLPKPLGQKLQPCWSLRRSCACTHGSRASPDSRLLGKSDSSSDRNPKPQFNSRNHMTRSCSVRLKEGFHYVLLFGEELTRAKRLVVHRENIASRHDRMVQLGFGQWVLQIPQ